MNETAVFSKKTNLKEYWHNVEEGLKDSGKKVQMIKNFKAANGLSVIQYPVGIPITTLEKVCKCIENANLESFDKLVKMSIDVGHEKS